MSQNINLRCFSIVLLIIFFATANPAFAADITGWGGFKWGDSIEMVKKKINFTSGERKADSFVLRSQKVVGGKNYIVAHLFDENGALTEVILALNPSGEKPYLTDDEAGQLCGTLKKKYGRYKKSLDGSLELYEWSCKSGNLTVARQKTSGSGLKKRHQGQVSTFGKSRLIG
ncbi:MAG: hypothetical protein L6406_04845 [Desulfobacterales bacterium]|nr:hypothetical protein [Desulfobacterales bacterium]